MTSDQPASPHGLGIHDDVASAGHDRDSDAPAGATDALLPDSHPRHQPGRNHRQLSISPSPHPAERRADAAESSGSSSSSSSDDGADAPHDDEGAPLTRTLSKKAQALREKKKKRAEDDVTWSSLPRKGQLAILTLARLSEPLTQTSLQSYLYYQLQSFDRSQTPAQITSQAGIVTAAFAAAQAVTSVAWGRVADARWGGRKLVILVGLLGTALGTLGFGFSTSWYGAVVWRVVAGVLNGNVGVMRTMISEIVKDRKYLSRAFLLMPMCFNIGVIIGPVMGGLMADPVGSYPSIFGPGSLLGGADGVGWMQAYPYALPNIVSAVYLVSGAALVFFGLEETHESLRDRPDVGTRIGKTVKRTFLRLLGKHDYTALPTQPGSAAPESGDLESHTPVIPATPLTPLAGSKQAAGPPKKQKLPFRRLWTRNVVSTLISHFLLAMGVGTFNALWFLFLSAPRFDPANPHPDGFVPEPPIHFTGGLGLPPPKIGMAMAILGTIGITLQLFLYPRVSGRWGTLRSFQVSVLLFPVVYLLVPFLSIVPSSTEPPKPASGVAVWAAVAVVLALQVLARTFALPATGILVNNASPHPSVLGTVHGVAQSVSSAARTLGPMGAGWLFGVGLDMGVVGLAFWTMMIISAVEVVVSWFVWEGDGHEIWLEGEREAAEAAEAAA